MGINGMTRAPLGDQAGGWSGATVTDEQGIPTSAHQVPNEQFVHSVSDAGDCLCGPTATYVMAGNGRVVPQVHHVPLDPDFYWYSDWGPDGPILDPDFL